MIPARRRNPSVLLAAPLLCGFLGIAGAATALWGLLPAGRAVPIKLPAADGGEPGAAATTGHVIAVLAGGDYLLGGHRLSRAELDRRLTSLGRLPGAEREEVLIRADANAPFEQVAWLLERCRAHKLGAVRFEVAGEARR